MVRKAYEKLPKAAQATIDIIRADIKRDQAHRHLYLTKGEGYLAGLRDAGLITESDRKALFCYLTI